MKDVVITLVTQAGESTRSPWFLLAVVVGAGLLSLDQLTHAMQEIVPCVR